MNIEDLKKMSKGELERAKVIVVTKCPNCPSFHGTFSFSNCGRNNDVIKELKNGFSEKCELIDIAQVMEVWDKKKRTCTCERCMDERTRNKNTNELKK